MQKKKKRKNFRMYTCFSCTRKAEAFIYLTRLLPLWPWTWRFRSSMSSWKLLCHFPHQQVHIILTHYWNTSVSLHFVINPLFLSCAFSLSPGVERPWRPCHHLSPVLWKSHSERLRWQHTQSVVCCYWKGELLFIYVFI